MPENYGPASAYIQGQQAGQQNRLNQLLLERAPLETQRMQTQNQAQQEQLRQLVETGELQRYQQRATREAQILQSVLSQPPETQQSAFDSVAGQLHPNTVKMFAPDSTGRVAFNPQKAQQLVQMAGAYSEVKPDQLMQRLEYAFPGDPEAQRNALREKEFGQKAPDYGSSIEAIAQAQYGKAFTSLSGEQKKNVLKIKKEGDIEVSAAQGQGMTKEGRAKEKADIIIDKTQEAFDNVSHWTAGLGSLLTVIPGTPAKDLEKVIDTIKANIGFEELNAMREASKTGGALGQVTVREIEFLQSVISSLDQAQSPDQLKKNLKEIQQRYRKVRQSYESMIDAKNAEVGDIITAPNGQQVRIIKVDPNGDHDVEPVE